MYDARQRIRSRLPVEKKRGVTMQGRGPIRSILAPLFPAVSVFVKTLGLVYSKRSMLRELGWVESVRTRKPCSRDGSPVPWMNYHVIGFLRERLNDDLTMFEYGGGNSTVFYAAHVGHVTSVEMDEDWFEHVRTTMPANVRLMFYRSDEHGEYATMAARQDGKFDIVVVDAADRTECLLHAADALTERGVVMLDDCNFDVHAPGIECLRDKGFRRLDFEGIKPASIRAYRTSIFYRDGNCLGI